VQVAEKRGGSIVFGPYCFDLKTAELTKQGRRVRLPGQAAHILLLLLERNGELINREELQHALWPEETFVDFDRGLNNAISRIREALGDHASSPRFIETLPKRGYRFIAEISVREHSPTGPAVPPEPDRDPPSRLPRIHARAAGTALLLLIAAAIGIAAFDQGRRHPQAQPRPSRP